jgi:hypothetical protein
VRGKGYGDEEVSVGCASPHQREKGTRRDKTRQDKTRQDGGGQYKAGSKGRRRDLLNVHMIISML